MTTHLYDVWCPYGLDDRYAPRFVGTPEYDDSNDAAARWLRAHE